MALTENTLTLDEATAAIAANPAIVEVFKSALPADKFAVLPKADFDALESVHVGNYVSKTAPLVEGKVKELTGIEKTADEKWFDYNARALAALATERANLKTELDTLKGSADISDAVKQRMAVLEGLVTAAQTEKQNLISAHQAEVNQLVTGNAIINDVAPVRATFIKDAKLTKAIEIMHNSTIKEMQASAKVEPNSGKTIFFDANNKALMNADGTFVTSAQLYSTKMADFIDSGKVVTGANGERIEISVSAAPAGVKTQTDLTNYLRTNGIIAGTPAFTAEWKKFGGASLPRN